MPTPSNLRATFLGDAEREAEVDGWDVTCHVRGLRRQVPIGFDQAVAADRGEYPGDLRRRVGGLARWVSGWRAVRSPQVGTSIDFSQSMWGFRNAWSTGRFAWSMSGKPTNRLYQALFD
jgi:hypothetical protein